jgi:hypothetical protein
MKKRLRQTASIRWQGCWKAGLLPPPCRTSPLPPLPQLPLALPETQKYLQMAV